MTTVVEKLDNVLKNMGLYSEDEEGQDALLENIDSLMFIQMIVGIESEFGLGIPDEKLLAKNFAKKSSIVSLIDELGDKEIGHGIY